MWLLGCDAAPPQTAFRGAAQCGNGRVEDGEACDLGFANRPDGPCRACALPRCGDGIVDEGEACDEGEAPTGRCSAECTEVWPRQWTRTFDETRGDEPVVAVVALSGGDFVHVGAGPDDDTGGGTIAATRRTAAADVVWRWVSGEEGPTRAKAAALGGDGTLYVVGDVAATQEPPIPGAVWVVALAADGSPRWQAMLGTAVAVDVATHGSGAWVASLDVDGASVVSQLAADGSERDGLPWPDPSLGPIRSLTGLEGGVFVGTGSREGAGAVARLGGGEWVAPVVSVGEVVDLHWDGVQLLVAATEVTGGDELPAFARPTQVRVLALSPSGEALWSTVVEGDHGREAGSVALVADEVVVIGSERLPASVCSEDLCPTRPWLGTFDIRTGMPGRGWLPPDVPLGAGTDVTVAEDAVLFGGATHRLFARPDGWLVRAALGGTP